VCAVDWSAVMLTGYRGVTLAAVCGHLVPRAGLPTVGIIANARR